MYFSDAVANEIEGQNTPLLTEYDFHRLSYQAFKKANEGDIKVRNKPRSFDASTTRRTIRQLERRRLIVRDPDFKGAVWQALKVPPVISAEEAICIVDPFASIAYLSALERHGFTDRSPKSLLIRTYSNPQWGQRRHEKMMSEIPPSLLQESITAPHKVHHRPIVRRRPVDTIQTKTLGETQKIRGVSARISTIGQTFLDSLERPDICGGMRHVVSIWQRYAPENTDSIINLLDISASPINKVRAGFLLELTVSPLPPKAEAWVRFAQRGGSRKLDPDKPYAPNFSEKWMLSLNV